MKGAYEMYPLGLRLSHLALLRNLDRFAGLSPGPRSRVLVRRDSREESLPTQRVGEYVRWYVDFLDVHLGFYRWPAFNIADACILAGVLLFSYYSFKVEAERKAQ